MVLITNRETEGNGPNGGDRTTGEGGRGTTTPVPPTPGPETPVVEPYTPEPEPEPESLVVPFPPKQVEPTPEPPVVRRYVDEARRGEELPSTGGSLLELSLLGMALAGSAWWSRRRG